MQEREQLEKEARENERKEKERKEKERKETEKRDAMSEQERAKAMEARADAVPYLTAPSRAGSVCATVPSEPSLVGTGFASQPEAQRPHVGRRTSAKGPARGCAANAVQ